MFNVEEIRNLEAQSLHYQELLEKIDVLRELIQRAKNAVDSQRDVLTEVGGLNFP